MVEGSVSVVSPGAYMVSDGGGSFGESGSGESGVFFRDARHLSRFVVEVEGETLVSRSADVRGSSVEFQFEAGDIEVSRRREVGFGVREEISFTNHGEGEAEFRVDLLFDADFLDVFEVRGYAKAKERGKVSEEVRGNGLRFSYERGDFRRATTVEVSGDGVEAESSPGGSSEISDDTPPSPGEMSATSGGASIYSTDGGGAGARPDGVSVGAGDISVRSGVVSVFIRLDAGETRTLRVSITFEADGEVVRWREPEPLYPNAPEIFSENTLLARTWKRSVEDLETLSFDAGDGLLVPAAGSPWYMALFGRDSLITSHMTMMLGAESAKNTLRALARHRATNFDDFTDSEPGKILHEMRSGELAHFGEVPHSPYFGTADATPLFLILLGETWKWTGDDVFVREMEASARDALAWVLRAIELGGGFIKYERRSPSGLENHSWKDSDDSMLFRNGTRANTPISACEIQGYAYDALLRTAELSEKVWNDISLAVELREEAASLAHRFDRDFWMDDRKYYALALDGEGRKVDSITSNAGHLLWSGIAPDEKAKRVAEKLLGDELFSGWGVRTMAEGESGFDPDSYHNGSIWPHDNAIVAEGLRRYGFRGEAKRVARAIFEAAEHFEHRLPEVFAGHRREGVRTLEKLPASCSPQAWAAASAISFVRTMLDLDPNVEKHSISAAENPSGIRLSGVPAFGEFHDVSGS